MALLIELTGEAALDETRDLRDWIARERIRGVDAVSQQFQEPGPGEQGPIALAVISVILGSAAVVELVKSIHVWITTRKRTIKVKITDGDRVIEVDCDNPDDLDTLVKAAGQLSP